jgi:Outer membrane protein beta-barrel domain
MNRKMLTTMIASMLVIALLAMPAMAQDEATGGAAKGFKVGVNMATLGGSDAGDVSSRIGFAFGGFVMFELSPSFAIQPEVLYSMKGAKETILGTEVTTKLDYIEIPVLFTILVPSSSGGVTPRFYAGPNLALKASAKVSGGGLSVDISEFVKSTDFGVTVGAGLGFGGGKGFMVDVRYTLGLSTIDNGSPAADVKNNCFSILGGMSF